ncbi:MAG: hypothetical protein KDC84_10325 [Crocinitomicaceae bacterium]|nr:hypothetical protein [Crocinitomicaceae bacterium]
MKFTRLSIFLFLLIWASVSDAQTDSTTVSDTTETKLPEPKKEKFEWFEFKGYLKFMQTLSFADLKNINVDNLIHNRLNFKFYIPKGGNFTLQLRNRIQFGGSVNFVPGYGEATVQYDGIAPFEFLWISNDSKGIILDSVAFVFSTVIDRLYYDYSNDKFQIRLGRQRVNWGINTTWNPNDIFNSYNIYDFDYEERQGADAVRLKFFPNYMSSFDLAYKFTGRWADDVFALKYLFNKASYDFQFLAGKFKQDVAMGFGWAGSIKTVGFKGEMTYFQPYQFDTLGNLSASVSLDYSWAKGVYLMGTYLFNSTGSNHPINPTLAQVQTIPNAKYLMPAKHNLMAMVSYQFSPIFFGALSTIYSFEINSFILFPSLTFSLKQNLDLDLIAQIYFQELPGDKFKNIGNGIFWRLKWSF